MPSQTFTQIWSCIIIWETTTKLPTVGTDITTVYSSKPSKEWAGFSSHILILVRKVLPPSVTRVAIGFALAIWRIG